MIFLQLMMIEVQREIFVTVEKPFLSLNKDKKVKLNGGIKAQSRNLRNLVQTF